MADFNAFGPSEDGMSDSVRMLTDRKYDEDSELENNKMYQVNQDFDEEDNEPNPDAVLNKIEQQVKILNINEAMRNATDANMRAEFLKKFREEVDFHHKVCYRFEKAYRLGKQIGQGEDKAYQNVSDQKKFAQLNMEIIEIISDHSDYIEHEPMAIFYCLYFCIYYKNDSIVNFLRTLIQKINVAAENNKILTLLKHIDENGLVRLRTAGE